MPTPEYKWNRIKDLNRESYEKNKNKSLAAIRSQFTRSHNGVIKLNTGLTEKQLLTPGY
jgi:hypothetical protein